METISFHSNQSSYPIGTKKHNYSFPPSIDAICGIWKESASMLQRRSRLKMMTMDGRRMPAYTISSPMSLRLRWANNRLNKGAEEYEAFIEAQAGFRKHMSTIDNIFVLNGLITHCINSSEYLYCCFVDFTKAFDYVERDILWYKLIKIGVRGHMLDIIKSMYNTVQSRVKNNNTLSETFSYHIAEYVRGSFFHHFCLPCM